jgi:hypothetical protein
MSLHGSTHTSAFDVRIDEMLEQGATLAEVEEFLERQAISEELRSVLWLRAWAENADRRPGSRLRTSAARW